MELVPNKKVNTGGFVVDESIKPLVNYKITAKSNIEKNVYVARIGNTNKFSKGNISAWTGAAKSKKTFAITMLASSMLAGVNLYDKFQSYKKNSLLWIDTEQSPYDVQRINKRIVKLVNSEHGLDMYGLRPLTPAQRIIKIDEALKLNRYDVMIIDGARDLLMNINDPVESTEVATKLMKWCYDFNMHIAVVIHKSATGLRGHIGRELENKSETVIEVKRNEDDINISEIKEVYGRGKGFEPFNFFIDSEALPVVGDVDIAAEIKDNDDMPF